MSDQTPVQPLREDLVDIVATATEAHHIEFDRTDADGNNPCVCDRWWDSAEGPGWDEHMAEVALAALSETGRLLPEPTDTRTEWGVWWYGLIGDRVLLTREQFGARRDAEEYAPRRVGDYGITRYEIRRREHRMYADHSTWSGPWLPVRCCDMHNQHCESPSELCCRDCTEASHDTFPVRHADGSTCVLAPVPTPPVEETP